jgi:GNAT superfamily N-acetyltransferase
VSLSIRRASRSEAPRLGELAARLFREAYGPTHPEPTLSTYLAACFNADAIAARLGEPAHSALVVENPSGDWFGYAELRVGPPEGPHISLARPLPSVAGLEIVRFYVARSQHGRGVAQALMEAAEEVALAAGCDVIWLQAWQEAPQALRFYQKAGFDVYGTATFAFGTRTDHDYLLVKPLRAGASARQAAG